MTALLFQAPIAPSIRPKRPATAEPPAAEPARGEDAQPTPAPTSGRRRGAGRGTAGEAAVKAENATATAPKETAAEPPTGGGRPRRGAKATQPPAEEDAGGESTASSDGTTPEAGEGEDGGSRRRRRRNRRKGEAGGDSLDEGVTALSGSTRLEAKRQRRREGRDLGRRRVEITEAEFLARREAVARRMVVREADGRTQIAVLEDDVLVEHYVARRTQRSMVGNVYLGRVQNVLPSMEAAFVDVGKGRNAVLYAGEVNWDAAGLTGQPRRIEQALAAGDSVMAQVTKDPIGHKGARLTAQITFAGRYLVLVPGGGMTGISRKLPDVERVRLKKLLKQIVPEGVGVIVRTAAEGATDAELAADVERLTQTWAKVQQKATTAAAPSLLKGEPDLAIRVVRDIFNEDFTSLTVSGESAWNDITGYLEEVAPELRDRVTRWTSQQDVFAADRIDEQLAKGLDRKVWLPSGGSLVIDRTEAMTVIDVNTGKFTGTGGTLEETVTRNNLEAAEEIVRQLRLRDIGGIIVIDFIDMVLESNRDLVLRRLVEALSRDRTRHQVAEVTSLGLVQMTRKRVGQGLVEVFSETCDYCGGRGFIVHSDPVEKGRGAGGGNGSDGGRGSGGSSGGASGGGPSGSSGAGSGGTDGSDAPGKRKKRGGKKHRRKGHDAVGSPSEPKAPAAAVLAETSPEAKATLASIAAAAAASREQAN
jgi:ribonuclease E